LAAVPDAFLAEPWRMVRSQQEASRCMIGVDYPAPRVDARLAVLEAKARIARIRSSTGAREASRRVYLRHGSRKPGSFRGSDAEARYRAGLLQSSTHPPAPSEPGPFQPSPYQPELFG
jgi:hypothetical protein